jgi:hypothetical protein
MGFHGFFLFFFDPSTYPVAVLVFLHLGLEGG